MNPAIQIQDKAHIKDDMNVLELTSYLTGEPFSEEPSRVSPVIASFLLGWSNAMAEEDRDRLLLPLLSECVDTKDEHDERRAYMVADWLICSLAPEQLTAAGLEKEAHTLRALDTLDSIERAAAALPILISAWHSVQTAANVATQAASQAAEVAKTNSVDPLFNAAWDPAWTRVIAESKTAAAYAALTGAGRAALSTVCGNKKVNTAVGVARAPVGPKMAAIEASAQDLVRRMCRIGRANAE